MIRRLINKWQGKTHGAKCWLCEWDTGRRDLTKDQALNRLILHLNTRHGEHGVFTRA